MKYFKLKGESNYSVTYTSELIILGLDTGHLRVIYSLYLSSQIWKKNNLKHQTIMLSQNLT